MQLLSPLHGAMYVVIALLLALLGGLATIGFFILRELLFDSGAAQQKDAADVLAELQSAKTSLERLRLEVAAMKAEISGMKGLIREHLNEALMRGRARAFQG